MGKLVKDQLTGEKRPAEELYCITTSKVDKDGKIHKTNKYYTSQEAYEAWERNKNNRTKCIDAMYEILDYESFQKIPGFFIKKLSEWEPYGYDVILKAIELKYNDLIWIRQNKSFGSETHLVMYLCKVIENALNDALKIIKYEKKMSASAKNNDIADGYDDVELADIGTKKKGADVINLLGKEEWI